MKIMQYCDLCFNFTIDLFNFARVLADLVSSRRGLLVYISAGQAASDPHRPVCTQKVPRTRKYQIEPELSVRYSVPVTRPAARDPS